MKSLCIRRKSNNEYILLVLTFEKELLMVSKVLEVYPDNQTAKEQAAILMETGDYNSLFYANGRERIWR